MRSSEVTDLCWFQSRTFPVLNWRHVNETSGSFHYCLVLHSAFHHIFAHWANIFHVDLLKCAFVLQACVLQMCLQGLLSLGLLFKSTFCRSLMPGTCSAQSISLHGPPAPSRWVLIKWTPYAQSLLSLSTEQRHLTDRMQNNFCFLSKPWFLFLLLILSLKH